MLLFIHSLQITQENGEVQLLVIMLMLRAVDI